MALPEDDGILGLAETEDLAKECPDGGYMFSHIVRERAGAATGDRYQLVTWRYADEFRGEQAFVIDRLGRLIKPNNVVDRLSQFCAEKAEIEIWREVSLDWLVLYWCKPQLHADAQFQVINQPKDTTPEQKGRARMIGRQLLKLWNEKMPIYATDNPGLLAEPIGWKLHN